MEALEVHIFLVGWGALCFVYSPLLCLSGLSEAGVFSVCIVLRRWERDTKVEQSNAFLRLSTTANAFCVPYFVSRHHNKITSIDGRRTRELVSVETLDLSNNDITELRSHCFPSGLQIKDL